MMPVGRRIVCVTGGLAAVVLAGLRCWATPKDHLSQAVMTTPNGDAISGGAAMPGEARAARSVACRLAFVGVVR